MSEHNEASGTDLVFESRGLDGFTEGQPLVMLLHGRGSNERDLLGLHPYLEKSGAMGSPLALITPRATFSGQAWGYGPGWAWYRYIAEDRVEVDTLEESLVALDRLIDRLPELLGATPGPLLLGGFSQGGTTALAWALTRPGRVRGVINLSGFLVRAPSVDQALDSGPDALDVFWGHGQADPAIPFQLGEKGRGRLREVGVALEVFDHPSGHTITPGELTALSRWMETLV
ncbi:MAG: hypothetical protein EA351_10600 [Gemmatimonadales bacterium]|nr:MAG: hypothetical protein EA351_10600 [Gemmatimonadales bacterium]